MFRKRVRAQIAKQLRKEFENAAGIRDRRIDFIPSTEAGVLALFGRFFDLLGFSRILHVQTACPDCTAVYEGRQVRVELEYLSSNFILHGHSPSAVDLVVCWKKDRSIPVPVIAMEERLLPYLPLEPDEIAKIHERLR